MTNENIRIAIDEEFTKENDGPYFYQPYPKRLVQVKEGETDGGRDVIEVINEHWPAGIEELVAESDYSGSFIRNILRNHYVPEDVFNTVETSTDGTGEESQAKEDYKPTTDEGEIDNDWHVLFRLGIRAGMEKDLQPQDAFTAFESGFLEGRKLLEEDSLNERL